MGFGLNKKRAAINNPIKINPAINPIVALVEYASASGFIRYLNSVHQIYFELY